MSYLNSLAFERLLWLVPIFFMFHNLEEAPFMESWSRRLPLKIHPAIPTRQFVIAVAFLTAGVFVVTYFEVEHWAKQTGYLILLGIQTVLLFNAFIPHIVLTLRFRMYSPGVVTAILVTLSFSFYLFRRAFAEHLLTWTQFWILLGIAPFAMVISVLVSLQIGKALDRQPNS